MTLGDAVSPTTACDLGGQTAPDGKSGPADIASVGGHTGPLPLSFEHSSRPEELISCKSTEVERGRSILRKPRVDNPLEKAHSRSSKDIATIEVNVKNIEARLRRRSTILSAFLEDLADPRASFEDNLLEPCPDDTACCSVSHVISQPLPAVTIAATALSRVRLPGSNDTHHKHTMVHGLSRSSVVFRALYATPMILPENLLQLLPTMSYAEYLEPKTSVMVSPASYRLPQEITRQILFYLAPVDFNSARHACRLWYISSLERRILETMLRRGGWSKFIHQHLAPDVTVDTQAIVNDEWLMSKRIARECALGPDWTGNGYCPVDEDSNGRDIHQTTKTSPFIRTCTTDFTESGIQYPCAEDGNSGLTFTVSTCGKFLMVATGCLVYIYALNCSASPGEGDNGRRSGALRPITTVICPRRALACSMDTSSQRYAIAVLMDGRMGMVCDLTNLSGQSRGFSPSKEQTEHTDNLCKAPIHRGGDYHNRISIKSSRQYGHYLPVDGHPQRFTFPVITAAGSTAETVPPGEFQRDEWRDMLQSGVPETSARYTAAPSSSTITPNGSDRARKGKNMPMKHMPIEQSVPTMYAPLCSADDPPRSVALCPQRRCVAFGCSSGIELHWVDALTGQDLNRWFPLTAPSDYLFFLPPRAGVDSAKKLRLISSAGKPDERPVIAEKYGPVSRSKTTPFWGTLSGRYSGPWVSLGAGDDDASRPSEKDNSDHYRAVPLSDGYHVLFTDPITGLLCLGSDAPIGGPTKLLRKIWFAGPPGGSSPLTYAGSSDLRHGVRVVASYGSGLEKSIWLFSVPGDVFADSMIGHGSTTFPCVRNNLSLGNGEREWIEWWSNVQPNDWIDPMQGDARSLVLKSDRIWPVQVRGQEIGRCHGVTDLAIDAGPNMTIWAFAKDGSAQTWQIDDGSLLGTVRNQFINRDGTVRENDHDGDVHMDDMPLSTEIPETISLAGQTYDGTASISVSRYVTSNLEPELGPQPGSVDGDGDTFMTDGHAYDSNYESDDSFQRGVLARDRLETTYRNSLFSGRSHAEQIRLDGLCLIEETEGISRIEVDIR